MTRAQDVDVGFVSRKRSLGASWSAIARMTGCAEIDLRRQHDTAFRPASDAVPRRPDNPREAVMKALRRAGLHPDSALVLARLWQANGARLKGVDLARGIAGGGLAQDVCADAKRDAKRLGVEFVDGGAGFALSAEGIVRISELANLKGRP